MKYQKINTEEFKLICSKLYNNKYDYTEVKYRGTKYKVIINCPEHGKFEQRADSHLNGFACSLCSYKLKFSNDEFLEKANLKHNFKYIYLEMYKGGKNKLKIKCPKHGIFKQKASSHLRGQGCFNCAIEDRSFNLKLSNDEFLEKANNIHKNKYIYNDSYLSLRDFINIECKKHGVFTQLTSNHLLGEGCLKCAIEKRKIILRKSSEVFLKQANDIHQYKYTYLTSYIDRQTKIKINCPIHGIFEQRPANHIRGQGCPNCVIYFHSVSKLEKEWLDFLNIPKRNIKLPNLGRKRVDGFDPSTNTVYEFYGDYFHGNPKIYDQEEETFFSKTFGNLYQKTIDRENLIKSLGYHLISIWENDYKIQKSQRKII